MTTSNFEQQLSKGFGYAKALIFGEYAVMYGAPCLVAALDRRVWAQVCSGGAPKDQFAADVARYSGCIEVDTEHIELENSDFFDACGRKLGIGSSAAAFVATFHASALAKSEAFDSERVVMQAVKAHRAFQGGVGSGVDILASAIGGLVLARNCPDNVEVQSVVDKALPPFGVFMMHDEAPTTSFVKAAHALDDDPQYKAIIQRLTAADEVLAQHVLTWNESVDQSSYIDSWLKQIDAMNPLLEALQNIIQKTILTPKFNEMREIARKLNVVVKPSGAGGGDICLAFAKSAEAVQLFADEVARLGVDRLEAGIAPVRIVLPFGASTAEEERNTVWRKHAISLESALARLYVTILVDIALIALSGFLVAFLLYHWSTMAVLMVIGFLLFGFLVGMGVLRVRRKKCVDNAKALCAQENLEFEALQRFVEAQRFEFTLAHAALSADKVKTDEKEKTE